MLRPEYLDNMPQELLDLYSQAEADILADMARRISTYDYYIPAAAYQYEKLIEMGAYRDYVVQALASQTGRTRDEIEQLMKEAAEKALGFDDAVYTKAGLNPPPLSVSPNLQMVLAAGLEKTNGLFENLARTTANTSTKQFEHALDRAYMQITTGAFDHGSAIRGAVKSLAAKGLAAQEYASGRTDTIEVAVRRAVLTGVNQTALKLQDARADQMGADLVEVTAHAGARPSHALWQGKIFSRSGTHPDYPNFAEATGYGTGPGLGGWNCRHSWFPFFEGISEPGYTQAELEDMDAKKHTYNGQQLTDYEASQKQRHMESQIRRCKREYTVMEAAQLPTEESAAKIAHWRGELKDFIKQTGMRPQMDRAQLGGFGREAARRATQAHRRTLKIAEESEKAYNEKRDTVREEIRSLLTPKTLNLGNQNKHILGDPGYTSGRSYIFGNAQTAQELIDRYHGTGEIRFSDKGDWIKKEFVRMDHDIGMRVNPKTGEGTPTNTFAIHYSKNGTHVVPAKRRD